MSRFRDRAELEAAEAKRGKPYKRPQRRRTVDVRKQPPDVQRAAAVAARAGRDALDAALGPALRTVSTTRTAGKARARMLPLVSPTMLAWARAQPSAHDGGPGGDPHHWPLKSHGVVDLLVIPLSRQQHDDAHRGWLDDNAQDRLLGKTLRELFTRAEHRETALRVLEELVLAGRGEAP